MKLADIHGSEPCARKGVGVQISPWAPSNNSKSTYNLQPTTYNDNLLLVVS